MPNRLKKKKTVYRRVLLKISGEALAGTRGFGIDAGIIRSIARQIVQVKKMGVDMALVIGGGNIYRGADGERMGLDRVSGDYMGMLATIINALAMQNALEQLGASTRVLSAIEMSKLAEPYIRRRAMRHLEKGRIVIFAGGTGNPYFTTDTTAALRAIEMKANVILKATNVDGVYNDDPRKNAKAVRFKTLSHMDAINRRLRVMDTTALTLCMEHKLPIVVFRLGQGDSIRRVICGEPIGTIVKN